MEKRYRAALVGLGNIAWRLDQEARENGLTHASAYLRSRRAFLVGGCSPNQGEHPVFEQELGVPAYATLEEMIEGVKPDIISICSPQACHFEQTALCFQAGVPMIWLEKPPAASLSQLDTLIQKQKDLGEKNKVLVNYQRRYTECYGRLASLFRKSAFGDCRLIEIRYSRGLENNGSHMLDMLFFVLGENRKYRLEWVSTLSGLQNPSFGLSFEDGPSVVVLGLELPYHCIDISLTCEEGRISVLHGGMTPRVEERVEHEIMPGFFRLRDSESGAKQLGPGGFHGAMERALEDLIDAFEQDRQPLSSLRTAREAQVLIEHVRLDRGAIAA